MNPDITYILSMSCVLPAVAGLYRYNKIHSKYHPFIYMMIIAVLIETIIYVGIKLPAYAAFLPPAINIYTLLNFVLFLHFTNINGYISKKWMQWLLALACIVALFNYLYEHSFLKTYYYLLCFVSAVMLFISINILSRQTIATKYRLINNCWFWISSFSIIYNAFTLLIFGLYFFAMFNTAQGAAIGDIQHIANLVCYVFFAVAIIKIPEKK